MPSTQQRPQRSRRSFHLLLALACVVSLRTLVLSHRRLGLPSRAPQVVEGACVAWRATLCGTQYSTRLPLEDLPCSALVSPASKRLSGYCECADHRLHNAEVALLCGKGLAAEWKRARMRPFTCQEACEDKLRRHGPSTREDPAKGCSELAEEEAELRWADLAPPPLAPEQLLALRELWQQLDAAFVAADGLATVLPPGARGFGGGPDVDFVAAGLRMTAEEVARARAQWRTFASSAPAYPPLFQGRGIVSIGGGLRYLPPAWVSLRALRRTGCMLPVELWFLSHEMPTPALAEALRGLGVLVRDADEVAPGLSGSLLRGSPFMLKPLALLFSRFEEVLFLDADNLPLADPEPLFDWPPFREAGLLLWPDFWQPSAAPDALRVAPEAAAALAISARGGGGNYSDESGQIAVLKESAWRTLVLALFVNLQSSLYYRLLCSYMGTGDKETWRFAAGMAGGPVPASAPYPAGSVGVRAPHGRGQLLSNTMLQHSPVSGEPLFAHSNLHKWSLGDAPVDFETYQPRWQVATVQDWQPSTLRHGGPPPALREVPPELSAAEGDAWAALRALRCGAWFEEWAALRRSRHGEIGPDGYDAGAGEPVYLSKGMTLSEHAEGLYRKQWAWSWERVGS